MEAKGLPIKCCPPTGSPTRINLRSINSYIFCQHFKCVLVQYVRKLTSLSPFFFFPGYYESFLWKGILSLEIHDSIMQKLWSTQRNLNHAPASSCLSVHTCPKVGWIESVRFILGIMMDFLGHRRITNTISYYSHMIKWYFFNT